jgi:hypothetical protein
MKTILSVLFVSLFFYQVIFSQTAENKGKPIAEIFTDFHYNLNDTTKTTGFGLNRAYFGYSYLPGNYFSATLTVNIGNPDDLSSGSLHRRYAFFREASISWTKDKLNLTFGITGTRIYNYQQQFWGKRYIANTYQSLNGYGVVADLGILMDYKFNDILKGDISIMNGEGYTELQLDNSVKTSVGLTITPIKQLAFRLYGDINKPFGTWQYTLVGFAGFKNEVITIGAEASYKSNLNLMSGHDVWGLSGTAGINVFKKTEFFVRYDYSTSVVLPGELIKWNIINENSFAVVGLQYTFNPNVQIALDYQGTYPYDSGKQKTNAIFINGHFKF